MASGMSYLASEIEGGKSVRDAVADMYKKNRNVIFTGNGYSVEWPKEAAKRGLPNLNTTPKAVKQWASSKNIAVMKQLAIMTEEETKARAEVMYEAYNTTLSVEVQTMIKMVETGILPACAKDLSSYGTSKLVGNRPKVYASIMAENDKLKGLMEKLPSDMVKEAEYLCDTVKPQMVALRKVVDEAEGLMQDSLYPYPSYEQMLYHHHH